MKTFFRFISVFLIAAAVWLSGSSASADIMTPTVTRVYFEQDGRPYDKPVSFAVNCFGYNWRPGEAEKKRGSYVPEKVFSFSATCPSYGCKIYENYYLNYRVIDYCNLEGETGEKKFKIEKYANTPAPNCTITKNGGNNRGIERSCELRFKIPHGSAPQ